MGGFNKKITGLLNQFEIDYSFVPSAFNRPINNGSWSLNLPYVVKSKWKNPNFKLIVHAQDFCNYDSNGLCLELCQIEKHYDREYHEQIIFLHWDHNLQNTYKGAIKCVEFPSHSWELVEALKAQHTKWKSVYTKSKKNIIKKIEKIYLLLLFTLKKI